MNVRPSDLSAKESGWWRPDAPAPDFGARDVNINAALSYRTRWDLASGSADTRGIPCRIVPA